MLGIFFVFGVATIASTNFTSIAWQFGFTNIFRNLAQARFICFGKSLHALPAAPISGLKRDIFFFFGLVKFLFRTILGIFSPTQVVFFRTPMAAASLTTITSNGRSSLRKGNNTNTCFFVSISVLTNLAALK